MAQRIIRLSANPDGFGRVVDQLEEQDFVSAIPVQHTHLDYENDELGLYVGVWDTTAMTETAGPYTCDEFMWLLEGEVDIKNNKTGAMEKVRAGEAFVIPKGYDCQWHQGAYLRKFFVISEHPNESIPESPVFEGIVRPLAEQQMGAMTGAGPFAITGEIPVQTYNICYEDSTGKFTAGTWHSEPFESETASMPYHLFVFLLEGSLILNDENDEEHHFKTGDALFLSQGTACRWRITQNIRTTYAIVRSVAEDTNTTNQGSNNE